MVGRVMYELRVCMLVCVLLSVVFLLSGCDPIPLEDQETTPIDGRTSGSMEVPDETIVTPSLEERQEMTEALPETHVVNLDHLNASVTIKKTVAQGDVIDFTKHGTIIAKFFVAKIPNYNEVWLSVNGYPSGKYKAGNTISISDDVSATVSSISFREDNNILQSMVEFSFFEQEHEKYSQYLIEQDIGLHDYLESMQVKAESYTAIYSDVSVTIERISSFPKTFPNSDNLVNFHNSLIYKLPAGEGVAWLTILEKAPYAVTVDKNMEGIILTYLDRFPSFITEKTYCEKEIYLEERQAVNTTFQDKPISIEVSSILDATVTARLKVNDGETVTRGLKEMYIIDDSTFLIVDSIEINYEEKKDRVKLCLV